MPPEHENTKPVSDKQRAANRANAQASTGPRSPGGKRRSATNATTHGVWAVSLFPIPGGLYAEDPFEFWGFVEAIIEGLGPRDVLETQQAKQVALAYLRLDRLERLATDLADADGTLSGGEALRVSDPDAYLRNLGAGEEGPPAPPRVWIGTRDHVLTLLHTAHDILDVLREPHDDHAPEWDLLAEFVRRRRGDGTTALPGVWDDRHTPETPDEWKRAFDALVRRYWATNDEAITWVSQFIHTEIPRLGQVAGRALAVAAHRTLDNSFGRATQLRSRINRELVTHLGIYGQLQRRVMPDDDTTDDEEQPCY